MKYLKFKRILVILSLCLTLLIMVAGTWLYRLNNNISRRFAEKRFAPPVEFFSAPEQIKVGTRFKGSYFESLFARRQFRERRFGQPLYDGDSAVWSGPECQSILNYPEGTPLGKCIVFKGNTAYQTAAETLGDVQLLALDNDGTVLGTFAGTSPPQAVEAVYLEPELFAQYYGDKPTLRKVVSGEIPFYCRHAVLAIEDSEFLEHSGVSVTGIARAFLANLRSGRVTQGGSTITQQLVKNYFLTDERTLRRKVIEMAMAVLVEAQISKDEILETYMNLIYMGQNGSFQVRGFGAASEHYFGKSIADLNLHECSLLAAIVNSPGLFNPFSKPDNALKRRNRVLSRMHELQMIDQAELESAQAAPLPTKPQRSLTEPAPYFVQAVRRQIHVAGLDETEGLRVFTTLNLRAQEAAHQAVRKGLEAIEKRHKHIRDLKEKGKHLEAVLISADPARGYVQAVVGGRSYRETQFNRAIDSHRQVGSVMKPFVYLAALESLTPEGQRYSPLTLLNDERFTHKWQGQTWSPNNYDGRFRGSIPMFYALKESLNAPTARLGLDVGLSSIVDTARRMGVESKIEPLPSLTLGAFELYPWEVLQAYGSLSQFGSSRPLTYIIKVDDLNGETLYEPDQTAQQVVAPEAAALLVGMMKQTLVSGTGRGVRLSGFNHPAAGKTGTTNDLKDAWFAGFTPFHSAIAWVGYDDNTPLKLTGASGAVPIWTHYMKDFGSFFPPQDFQWPAGTERAILTPEHMQGLNVPLQADGRLEPVELIFFKGQAPEFAIKPDQPDEPRSFFDRFLRRGN